MIREVSHVWFLKPLWMLWQLVLCMATLTRHTWKVQLLSSNIKHVFLGYLSAVALNSLGILLPVRWYFLTFHFMVSSTCRALNNI